MTARDLTKPSLQSCRVEDATSEMVFLCVYFVHFQLPPLLGLRCLVSQLVAFPTAGVVAVLNARKCDNVSSSAPSRDFQRFVRYYIAVKEVDWNYAPSNFDRFDGGPLLKHDR